MSAPHMAPRRSPGTSGSRAGSGEDLRGELPPRPRTILLREPGESWGSCLQLSSAASDCRACLLLLGLGWVRRGCRQAGALWFGSSQHESSPDRGAFQGSDRSSFYSRLAAAAKAQHVPSPVCGRGTPGGGASLATEEARAGPCLCLLLCPGPLGPSPARPEQALLVTGILCWHQCRRRGWLRWGRPHRSSGMAMAVPVHPWLRRAGWSQPRGGGGRRKGPFRAGREQRLGRRHQAARAQQSKPPRPGAGAEPCGQGWVLPRLSAACAPSRDGEEAPAPAGLPRAPAAPGQPQRPAAGSGGRGAVSCAPGLGLGSLLPVLGRDIGKRLEVRRKVDACLGKANYISRLEHAQARLTLSYNRRGDLAIHLVSPMGTRSTLLAAR